MPQSKTDQALKALRGIVDAGGPQTPVPSHGGAKIEAPTWWQKAREKVLPMSSEPGAQRNVVDATFGEGALQGLADTIADPGNIGPGGAMHAITAFATKAERELATEAFKKGMHGLGKGAGEVGEAFAAKYPRVAAHMKPQILDDLESNVPAAVEINDGPIKEPMNFGFSPKGLKEVNRFPDTQGMNYMFHEGTHAAQALGHRNAGDLWELGEKMAGYGGGGPLEQSAMDTGLHHAYPQMQPKAKAQSIEKLRELATSKLGTKQDRYAQSALDLIDRRINSSDAGAKIPGRPIIKPTMTQPKSLPVIAPEAYNDVKADGLRLYSRLTDTFAKAPARMKPAKAISLAQSGASKEEISLRKLSEFLKARNPMEDIPREEIMGHLAKNPLELDVVRKGESGYTGPSREAMDKLNSFQHELETKYGGNWSLPGEAPPGYPEITTQEAIQFRRLQQEADDLAQMGSPGDVEYGFLQTPGPSENYGESLIKQPYPKLEDFPSRKDYDYFIGENPPDQRIFTSGHFTDDPNTLVWSRHNDRFLNPNQQWEPELGSGLPQGAQRPVGKGRFVEEIQSDWHQQGRERGYRPEGGLKELPPEYKLRQFKDDPHMQPFHLDPNSPGYNPAALDDWGIANRSDTGYLGIGETHFATPEEAVRTILPQIEKRMVPDAPFKDTYHELALKQQLLDAANDPSLEWLGVADAHTNAKLEGHIPNPGDVPREGTQLWYDKKHPAALQKLLEPLGGTVEKSNLASNVDPAANRLIEQARGFPIAGPGMWKASLTPELKELIKTRGFPAMAALIGLKTAIEPNRPE